MTTGLDIIMNNKPLQEHWFRRIVAIIIDSVIFLVIFSILSSMMALFAPLLWVVQLSLSWVILFIYSGIMEGTMGATIGKSVMKLKVVSLKGQLTMSKAFLRNVSKINGLLLFVDLLAGLATEGDPRQRYLDRMMETTVVEVGALGEPFQHTPPPPAQGSVPPPPPPPQ